jgi:hypothetical protein
MRVLRELYDVYSIKSYGIVSRKSLNILVKIVLE